MRWMASLATLTVLAGAAAAGPRALTGRLFDADGKPLGGRTVCLLRVDREHSVHVDTEPDGTFWFGRLEPGAWIVAPVKDHAAWPERLRVRARRQWADSHPEDVVYVRDGERRHVVVQLPKLIQPKLVVVHRGEPVVGATVQLNALDARDRRRQMTRLQTDVHGEARLPPVRSGDYRASLTVNRHMIMIPAVAVRGNEVRIVLPRHKVKVRFDGPVPKMLAHGSVQVRAGNTTVLTSNRLPVEVPYVPAGDVSVRVFFGLFNSTGSAAVGPAQPNAEVVLKVPAHGRLEIRAPAGSVYEVRGPRVRYRRHAGSKASSEVALPPGRYSVRVLRPVAGKVQTVDVKADTVTPVLLIDPKRPR